MLVRSRPSFCQVWQTSASRKGRHISIRANTVTKEKQSWDHSTAVVSDGVILAARSLLKKRWSFTIIKGDYNTIGLVTSAFNAATDEYVNKTANGWGYHQYNDRHGIRYQVGDVVDGGQAHYVCE